jgi:hypothetical protein
LYMFHDFYFGDENSQVKSVGELVVLKNRVSIPSTLFSPYSFLSLLPYPRLSASASQSQAPTQTSLPSSPPLSEDHATYSSLVHLASLVPSSRSRYVHWLLETFL